MAAKAVIRRWRAFFAVFTAFFTFSLASAAAEIAAPSEGRVGLEDPAYGRMAITGDDLEIAGGAFAIAGGETIRADRIVYQSGAGVVRASRNIIIEARGWTLLADDAVIYTQTRTATLANVEMFRSFERKPNTPGRIEKGEVDVVVIRAAEVHKEHDAYTALNVSLTSCGFNPPHYEVLADEVLVSPDGILTVRNGRLKWGILTLFRMSNVTVDPSELKYFLRPRLRTGVDARWGFFLETGVGIPGGTVQPDREILFSWRNRRGPGLFYEVAPFHSAATEASRLRFSAVWESETTDADDAERASRILASRNSLINGNPDELPLSYYLYEQRRLADSVGVPDTSQPLYAGDLRYLLDFRDHAALSDHTFLDVSLYKASDRDYAFEYDESAFLREWHRGSYLRLTNTGPFNLFRLHTAFRTDDSVSMTEYLPEARIVTFPYRFAGNFQLSTDLRTGYLRRYFDPTTGYSGFEAYRTHAAALVEYPCYLNTGLALTPFAAFRSTWYSDSRSAEPLLQSGFTGGAVLSGVLTGSFERPAGEILHQIRGALTYARTPATSADSVNVFDFDEIEDFMAGERLSLRLEQRLFAKRSQNSLQDIARLTLESSLILDEDERQALSGGSRYGPMKADLLLRPVEPLEITAAVNAVSGKGVQDMHAGILYRRFLAPGRDGIRSAGLFYRTLAEDADNGVLPTSEIITRLGYAAGRWGVDADFAYELKDNAIVSRGTILSRLVLTRDFHDVALSIGVSYNWADDDYSFSLRLHTRGYTAQPVTRP